MPDCYALTGVLREDAAGGLYRGVRRADGAPVVIRTLRADLLVPRELDRLRNEYETLRQLDGSGVLRPIELQWQQARLRLVLEGFDGDLLTDRFERPMEIALFLDVALQLVAALADLHRQGVVHRDLRPGNILVARGGGEVRLLGLGIAARSSPVSTALASTPVVEGSPAYMSPEQTGHMNRGVDHHSDLYSLGVILYELLTGELPFRADDALGWAHCHVARAPRSPTEAVPSIPPGLAAVVLKLLAKQAEDRYRTARGLGSDLERCRREWAGLGTVPPFALGTHDVSDRFLISPRLYGRERESAALVESFEQLLATGRKQLVLVCGHSGIGKSSLVQELRRSVVGARGYFVTGKYDQYQRDVPYATLMTALRDLLQQILTESNKRIEDWKAALQAALGANAQVIAYLVPQLSLILGPMPPVPRLPPEEAENRFHRVFQRFIGVFATPEHPLVLFLDDLQWLDPAGLELLTSLLTASEHQALLLIGAYRDNEVGPSHPLARTLDEIRASDVPLRELVLGPLPPAQLTRLVADTLRQSPEVAAPLVQLVHDKTAGNPFFAIHFLTMLHQEGLLGHDPATGGWTWNLAELRRQRFTDNVVELMLGRLRRMSAAAQTVLMQAACIGSTVDSRILALLSDLPENQLDLTVQEAVDEGLLWRGESSFTFLHDRVQEAAYALLAAEQRPTQHLRIGRLLLARTPPEQLAGNIFVLVGQLNRGSSLITSAAELERLAELNLLAGKQAKAATAVVSAVTYLEAGQTLLDAGAWESAHDLALDLHCELAECEYLIGNFGRSEDLLSLVADHARSLLERARVHRLRQRLLQLAGRFHEAMAVSAEALRLFGVSLPDDDDEIRTATDAELQLVPDNLAGRRVADLADVPITDDAEVRAFIGLLAEAMPLIYIARPQLWPLVTVRGVNVCLRRGHAEESGFVYSCYAMVLVGVCRDIPSAVEFSQTALALNDRSPAAAAWRGKLLFHHASVVNIWRHHIAVNLPLLDEAFRACLDSGDLVHAGYLTYNAIWLHLEVGEPLEQVVELAGRYAEFARQTHNDVVHGVVRVEEQFALSLRGRTFSATDLSDESFDEDACVAAIQQAGFGLGIAYHHIMKQVAAFHAGRFGEALGWAERAAPKLLHVSSMANEATYHFYRALTLTALASPAALVPGSPGAVPGSPGAQGRHLDPQLVESRDKLAFWAELCGDNFAARHALICAEIARLEGRDLDAMHLYDAALRSASQNGFGHVEALAAELAGRFYHSRGFDRTAASYLREARACYVRWGADGVVRTLDQQHPQLVEPGSLTPTELFSARVDQLDLLSVTKAFQAISSEIVLPRLQETLMRLVLEHAGAQRGVLLLADGESLVVHARAEIEGETTQVELVAAQSAAALALPMTLLNYVRRSGETVVLADAATDARYSADAYIARWEPRSVLALPITWQGGLRGIVYLENNLIAGAFITSKLAVLELLAAQAAISLETARLYTDLQQENAERRRAEEEVRQLNRELEQRVLDRTAQLEATNTELEAFSYSVSHDLRAPLRAVQGFSQILMENHADQLDDEARRLLVKVVRRGERMRQLIDDLLSFSRMGRKELSKQRVDLGELVRDVRRELEPDARGGTVRWTVAEMPIITGDRSMVRVVLVNLISNALKFSRSRVPAEIEIGVTSRACGQRTGDVVVFVRDNGVGFDPRSADQLFGVFQRLHREEEFEGTGIGLANVQRIIQRHGGRTWAEAAVDRGATFYFSLPQRS